MPTLVSMAADLHNTMASVESSREGDVEPLETSGNERPRDRDVEPRSKRLVADSTDQTETKITRTKKVELVRRRSRSPLRKMITTMTATTHVERTIEDVPGQHVSSGNRWPLRWKQACTGGYQRR